MKLNVKMSIIMIGIVATIVTGIALILIREASNISLDASRRGLVYLAVQQTEYWHGRMDGHMRMLRTLSNIMEDYDHIAAEDRRDLFDSMLRGVISANPSILDMYTVWRPNAVDGMDAEFIGRTGSTPTGQYAIAFTRETGEITARTSIDVEGTIAFLDGLTGTRLVNRVERVEPPIRRIVEGRSVYVVRLMVPVVSQHTNEVIAGVGLFILTDTVQPALVQSMSEHEEISAMAIYFNNGFVLAHFVPDRVNGFITEVDTFYGDILEDVANTVKAGGDFQGSAFSVALNTDLELAIASLNIGRSEVTWSIMVGATHEQVLAEVRHITRFTTILAIISIAVGAVVIFFFLTKSIRPIVNVAETLKDISEGEGDLTRRIHANSKDEIGDLAKYFNLTLEKIRTLVLNIKKETLKLSDLGGMLTSSMTETAAAVNEINSNVQSIKGRAITQSESVSQTNTTMGQITVNIDKLNGHVERQNASVSSSSSAIEEMLANIQSVTQTLVRNGQNVQELTEASDSGRNGLQEVASDIKEIARESEGLLEINSVMENIASQTNLLSMNAAIEAAHTGEAGRGFAVVAAEIRKLAENSSEQSKTISIVLKKIKSSIDKITRSTDNVLTRFEAINSSVKTVVDQETNIRHAMEEQGEGSKQVLESISLLNDITQNVKQGSKEMLEGSTEVIREGHNLEMATQEISGGMNEMASGANEINSAVNHINDLCRQNKESIDHLMREVSRFKIE